MSIGKNEQGWGVKMMGKRGSAVLSPSHFEGAGSEGGGSGLLMMGKRGSLGMLLSPEGAGGGRGGMLGENGGVMIKIKSPTGVEGGGSGSFRMTKEGVDMSPSPTSWQGGGSGLFRMRRGSNVSQTNLSRGGNGSQTNLSSPSSQHGGKAGFLKDLGGSVRDLQQGNSPKNLDGAGFLSKRGSISLMVPSPNGQGGVEVGDLVGREGGRAHNVLAPMARGVSKSAMLQGIDGIRRGSLGVVGRGGSISEKGGRGGGGNGTWKVGEEGQTSDMEFESPEQLLAHLSMFNPTS